MNSLAIRRGAASLGLLLLATVIQTPSAIAASGDFGPKVFTAADPDYAAVDSNGSFTGRVNFTTNGAGSNPMGWSFQVSPSVQAISTSLMTCQTFLAGDTGYQDYHPNIPMYYVLHSTTPNNPFGAARTLDGTCTFDTQGAGKAVLHVRFAYSVSDAGLGARSPSQKVMQSALNITYPS